MKKLIKGYIFVILSAILYGCMPLSAKFIYANGVNALSLVLYRNLLPLPFLAFLVTHRGESLSITAADELRILPISGIGLCLTPLLLYASYNYISSGMATTLHFVYPAFVALGGTLFFKQKLWPVQMLSVLLCTVGACLFCTPGSAFHPLGGALAVLSAVSMAAYVLLLGSSTLFSMSHTKFLFYVCLNGSVISLIFCLVTGSLALPDNAMCWLACLVFSLYVSIGAMNLFQLGTYIIGGQQASILSTFEPITSLIIGVLVFQEPLPSTAFLGTALIVLSTMLVGLSDLWKRKRAAS